MDLRYAFFWYVAIVENVVLFLKKKKKQAVAVVSGIKIKII